MLSPALNPVKVCENPALPPGSVPASNFNVAFALAPKLIGPLPTAPDVASSSVPPLTVVPPE